MDTSKCVFKTCICPNKNVMIHIFNKCKGNKEMPEVNKYRKQNDLTETKTENSLTVPPCFIVTFTNCLITHPSVDLRTILFF